MSIYSTFALFAALTAAAAAQTPTAQPAAPQAPNLEPGLYATLGTSMGDITVQLFEKQAPITVKNMIDLERGRKAWKDPKTGEMVRRPLYNGTTFHRVIAGFMIQAGDPKGDGTGDVGFTIKDEFDPALTFDRPGRLAMANIGEPNTGACQFFITVAPYAYGNRKHTIFGQVVSGQDVVEKISKVKTIRPGDLDKPAVPIRIVKIAFQRVGPAPANDPLGPPAAKKSAPAKK